MKELHIDLFFFVKNKFGFKDKSEALPASVLDLKPTIYFCFEIQMIDVFLDVLRVLFASRPGEERS